MQQREASAEFNYCCLKQMKRQKVIYCSLLLTEGLYFPSDQQTLCLLAQRAAGQKKHGGAAVGGSAPLHYL